MTILPLIAWLVPGCTGFCGRGDPVKGTESFVASEGDMAERGVDVSDGIDATECADLCMAALGYAVAIEHCESAPWRDPSDTGDTGDTAGSGSEERMYELTCTGSFVVPCKGRRPRGLRGLPAGETDSIAGWASTSAAMEAASVGAFRQLARDLRSLGAPPDLAARALDAARDEVRHARLMGTFGPWRAPRVTPTRPVDRRALACHNVAAGCIEETWGAVVARHQAVHARDRRVRAVMARVAPEEARHAQLAWDIQRWAGEDVAVARRRAERRLRETVRADRVLGLPGVELYDRFVAALPAG